MAVFENNLDYTKLIQFTNGSLQLASFVQIRNALIQKFKDIYGNDIDVSPATADGQYINAISLLINNIFQTIRQGYNSLDPTIATGQYLDTLCSYNNIFRNMASASRAQLYIYNSGNSINVQMPIQFMDKNGIIWEYDNGENSQTFPQGYTVIDNVICSKKGLISAGGALFIDSDGNTTTDPSENDWDNNTLFDGQNGTIYKTVVNNGLKVWQYSDAIIGSNDETDEELRSRRYLMLGNNSVTVLEGLKGALLALDGIQEVFIFNNNTGSDITNLPYPLNDGTPIENHNIYIALRYKEGVNIEDEVIGKIIYNKMTPGILTTETASTQTDTNHSYVIQRTGTLSNTIYWKKAKADPTEKVVSLNYTINSNYDSSVQDNIKKNLVKYIRSVKIDEYLTVVNLLTVLQQSDILRNGVSTYLVNQGNIQGEQKQPSNLSYWYCEESDITFTGPNSNNVITVTIQL